MFEGDADDLVSFELTDRDRALFLMHEYDLGAQLLAIKDVLHRNRKNDEALAAQINSLDAAILESTSEDSSQLEDWRIDRLHSSVFQDAAHSMSALGMLAPFIESLFVGVFMGLRAKQRQKELTLSARSIALDDHFWDPHYVIDRGGHRLSIVHGIIQLSDSIGLGEFLPQDLERTLSALFVYRNRMFHHGFEWPLGERLKFEQTIQQNKWPSNWFMKSLTGGDPWVFYLSTSFIQHCLETIDKVLEGVGNYLERHDDAE